MDYQATKNYLLNKPNALLDFPFGPQAAVFKVKGKMFALLTVQDGVAKMNLKCDPDEALALRDIFPSVIPGYHMNKKHWNTIILDQTIPSGEIERMIDRSYGLVVKSLKKSLRLSLELSVGTEVLYR
ncbi:MmcQ/YjbR family DNA-binding protein [Aurantivibrio infirmus]